MKFKNIRVEAVAVGVAIFILVYILMLRPVIGVANNGDFPRIMGSTGLQYMSGDFNETYFGYVNRIYKVSIPIPFGGRYFSTEIFIVALAVLLSQCVSGFGLFDIRYLSFLYSIVFLVSIYLIIRYNRQRLGKVVWLLAALLVFIFADIGYIAYFNSLYGEAVTLVFLLLMVGAGMYLVVKDKPHLWALIAFFAGAFFFAGAKVQNGPVGILAALLGLGLLKLRRDAVWRRVTILSAAAVVAVSCISYIVVPRDIKVCNKYQSVFYGIIKDSPNPVNDLEELGLNPDLAVLAGTNYFMKSYPVDIRNPAFLDDLFEKVSHFKIAGFYLKHPDRLIKKLEVAAQNAFKLKQDIGNYEKYPGVTYKMTANTFGLWSDFKMKVLPHSLLFVSIFYTACLAVLAFEFIRGKDLRARLYVVLLVIISLIGVMQLVIPIIGDGEADLSKHLFLFNVSFDMIFTAGAVYLFKSALGAGRTILVRKNAN